MALSIKTEEADRLARELARLTGETMTEAVTRSLRERLERERARAADLPARVRAFTARARPLLDTRPVTLAEQDVRLHPVDEAQMRVAMQARIVHGRGFGAAGLNFGDCFSYALAKVLAVPLLFVGDDFTRTGIEPALPLP
jgi:antitoxin VapB